MAARSERWLAFGSPPCMHAEHSSLRLWHNVATDKDDTQYVGESLGVIL